MPGSALANQQINVIDQAMNSPIESHAARLPLMLYAGAIAAALITGAAFAGWLNHGPQIFLSMAADAWAYCF